MKARQRTRDALLDRVKNGYAAGNVVFGYDNVRTPSEVRRVINPAEAAVVRRIMTLLAEGHGYTTVAKTVER